MSRRLLAVVVVSLLLLPTAEAKRRAAASRGEARQDPAGWLAANAFVLQSVEHPAPSFDLEPLRHIVGNAQVVGLGDATHGTREFYTVKLRMIDFLVRQMSFDVIALEAPLPLFDKIDQYVQGGAGDPRALLADADDRLGYRFWDNEETLAVIEWMREFNAQRGDRPAVHIAGADIYDGTGAAAVVVAYLQSVAPALAAQAEADYRCSGATTNCFGLARRVLETLESRRAELEPAGPAAYQEALQHATVVVQSLDHYTKRDTNMASNALWIREHRSRTGRIVVWAHGEHIGKTNSDAIPSDPLGMRLARALGSDYVAISTTTAAGTLAQWEAVRGSNEFKRIISRVPEPAAGSYEANFRLGPAPMMLIPLRGAVPAWLTGPARYLSAGVGPSFFTGTISLPAAFDAIVFIETTQPTVPLRPGAH